LLRDAGYAFEAVPADVDEEDVPAGLDPREVAVLLARRKAEAVAARHPGRVVLGADTVVAVGRTRYGKAETPDAARAMLRALGGTEQRVITGVAVVAADGRLTADAAEAIVAMRPMSDAELDAYVASGEWRGKAGAYGIQDQDPDGDPFCRITSGEFTTVVGLPMPLVAAMLAARCIMSGR